MAWYEAGSITFTLGTNIITGTGTQWANSLWGISPGQPIMVPGAGQVHVYEILSVDSDTQIRTRHVLTSSLSNSPYSIMTTVANSYAELARVSAERLAYYQRQMYSWQEIMTGEGDVILNAPDGTQVTISSFKKLTKDMNRKLDKTGGTLTGTLSSNVVSLSGNVHFTGETGHSFVSWRSSHTNLLIDCPSPYQAYTAIRWTEQNVRHLGALHCHAGGNTPNLTRISFSVYNTDDCHRFFADRYEVGVPGKTGTLYNDGNINGNVWGGNLSEYFSTDVFRRSRNIIGHVDTPFSGGSTCGVFKFNETLAGFSGAPYYGNLVNFQSNMASGGDTWFQLVNGNFMSGDLWIRSGNAAGSQSRWLKFYSTGNTTVDANGFIKAASPILRLFNNTRFDDVGYYSMPDGFTQAGAGAVNGEAEGAVAVRISEGVYQVTGAQGFALEGWQIELPTDDNRQPLIWAEREVDKSSVITIRTYHREHPNSPPFAQNKREGYSDGQPVDIPHGRWVDLRLEMPVGEVEGSE